MKQVLIFSGTTEGRRLSEILSANGVACSVCVATEYGELVMDKMQGVTIFQGRMDQQEMCEFMKNHIFAAVVDATHPYATEVSENIKAAAKTAGLSYLRLQRNTGTDAQMHGVRYVKDSAECVRQLRMTKGNILLTTGSKELSVYCKDEELRARLYVRVLPGVESIRLCEQAGLTGKQILALQGPFSQELNEALIHQYQIHTMVTKESGKTGGFPEKALAAAHAGAELFVIGNPELGSGESLSAVCDRLEQIIKSPIRVRKSIQIALIGAGMGCREGMTGEAEQALEEASAVFGAKRLIGRLADGKQQFPYYLAEDILPALEQLLEDDLSAEVSVAVLFSGDSGFYSGCEKLYRELGAWKEKREQENGDLVKLRIYPGISSIACLAARIGVAWSDACILSVHGKGDASAWKMQVLEAVRYHEKTFLLVSGDADIRAIGTLLQNAGLENCRIAVGSRLSYEKETVAWYQAADCCHFENDGLCVCYIENQNASKKLLSPGSRDAAFIRERIPMTKEEVRQLILCKLRLTENSVVYDIGSGTGSVTVDLAKMSETIRVYAVEQKKEALKLTEKNVCANHLQNVCLVEGKAPDALYSLETPTHAFIGGSGGHLKEIMQVLYEKNSAMHVVISAVSLETVGEINALKGVFPMEEEELICLQVSRAKQAGSYRLMEAQNPVYLSSFHFKPE